MVQLQQRSSRPTPALASTPEKPTAPPSQPQGTNGQEGSSRREQPISNGQPQRAGGLGLLGRVASGLLGSGSRKGSSDKKVRWHTLLTRTMGVRQCSPQTAIVETMD